MAYTIYKSDGTAVTVPDNTIDSQFCDVNHNGAGKGLGIFLAGRNAIDYGAPIAQNFLQMTENFCDDTPPPNSTALRGQLWFDKTNGILKVNVSSTVTADWRGLATIADSGAVTGYDGQVKVSGSTVSIWAGGAWRQIYPAVYS